MRGGRIQNKSAKDFPALIILVDVQTRHLLVDTRLSSAHSAALEGLNLMHLSPYLFQGQELDPARETAAESPTRSPSQGLGFQTAQAPEDPFSLTFPQGELPQSVISLKSEPVFASAKFLCTLQVCGGPGGCTVEAVPRSARCALIAMYLSRGKGV